MRAGLVEQFGRAALDQHFQQVERPVVDVGLRPLADLGHLLDDRVGGGLVADLAQQRLHAAQERIDLAGRVADDRVGQPASRRKSRVPR